MAEAPEDIIIIEDSDAAGEKTLHDDDAVVIEEEDSSKKKILIFGVLAIAIVLIIVIVLLLIVKSSTPEEEFSMDFIEQKLDENVTQIVEPSELENMIAKANYLYQTGSKHEALNLYEKIAVYSEAISQYNLGVAQLKDKQYKTALDTFSRAIQNDEKRCVSAINAAVCSLHLEDEESFHYYIDLAYAYLTHELDSPLYSYYYALINYYKQNYLEALSALKNPTSDLYLDKEKHLTTRLNAMFGNNLDAIEALERNFQGADEFSLGLLYARIGDLGLAIEHFEAAIVKNIEPVKAQLALGLVYLKAGQVKTGATKIQNITDMFPEEVYNHYPIKVFLKDSLFDPVKAQERYRNHISRSKLMNYQKLFYFSPYKVFNTEQTISYIRKGNANIFIDNVSSATQYLRKSSSSSKVNQGIAQAIQKALTFRIREANEQLRDLVKIQPKHSILHYNLALTYAQLGDLNLAHKHFLRSYYLDAKNYLSGIYAIMCSQIINKENLKMKSILTDSLEEEEIDENINMYKTLLHISQNNFIGSAAWLDLDYDDRPLYLMMDIIIANNLNNTALAQQSSKRLSAIQPNDILPNLIYIDNHFNEEKPKKYASKVLNYLKNQELHYEDLYFGPYVTRYLYIQQNLIIGRLYYLRTRLKNVLETTNENTVDLLSSLALASLYDKKFEEAYTLYNTIIDEMKIQDAYTLFLGAVASTAAQHHENAIALLELSKMKNSQFVESRYALGLLYLEVKNNQGAAIQLARVGNTGFSSGFFNFSIDSDKLLFEHQNAK